MVYQANVQKYRSFDNQGYDRTILGYAAGIPPTTILPYQTFTQKPANDTYSALTSIDSVVDSHTQNSLLDSYKKDPLSLAVSKALGSYSPRNFWDPTLLSRENKGGFNRLPPIDPFDEEGILVRNRRFDTKYYVSKPEAPIILF